jgi:hypothetical protein
MVSELNGVQKESSMELEASYPVVVTDKLIECRELLHPLVRIPSRLRGGQPKRGWRGAGSSRRIPAVSEDRGRTS